MNKLIRRNQGLIIAAVIMIALLYGGQQGWYKFNLSILNQLQGQQPYVQPNIENQFSGYWLTASVNPSSICVGASTTGSLRSNIPNGQCSVFLNANNAGWQLLGNAQLDGSGSFSMSQAVNQEGNALFRAVCCDAARNCKVSNDASLLVGKCNQPDSDGDGYSDADEVAAGTNPHDANDYPGHHGTIACGTLCVGKGYASGRGPVTSIGYCNSPEISYLPDPTKTTEVCCCTPKTSPPPDNPITLHWLCCTDKLNGVASCYYDACPKGYSLIQAYGPQATCTASCRSQTVCTDTDGKDTTIKGTCRDGFVVDTDRCISNSMVTESFCTGGRCLGTSTNCPSGTTCKDGACVKVYTIEECQQLRNQLGFGVAALVSCDGTACMDYGKAYCAKYPPWFGADFNCMVSNCCIWNCKK